MLIRKEKASRLGLLLLILLVLILVDLVGYMLIEKANPVDALFMIFISITTVGYREVFPLSTSGKMFTIFVIISGIGIVFSIAETIVENTLEGRLRRILGRRKMIRNIYQMRDHVILCGFGRMGQAVSAELAEQKIDFLIIEQLPERYAAAEERGFHAIQASATDEAALKVAGIEKASYFISLLASDADNMFAVLTARELNPRLKIISRAFDAVNEKKLYKIGADLVISPYQLSSTRIVSTVLKPNVVDFFDLAIRSQKISLSIEELRISGQSPLAGKRIRDSSLRSQYNAIVVAVKRDGQMFFNPPADFEIQAEDILIVLGEKNKLLEIV